MRGRWREASGRKRCVGLGPDDSVCLGTVGKLAEGKPRSSTRSWRVPEQRGGRCRAIRSRCNVLVIRSQASSR